MTRTLSFDVDGMHCASCALLIDEVLEDLPGVSASRTSRPQGRSDVDVTDDQVSQAQIIAAIEELGYRAKPVG
ncbi:heavy-metal-associated domain-containing protein [Mycobacteroides abscessus]|uniref:heavy-metal-associated domain-containing protein n=1 Tax=Mycobacteroides abscessus TaxID=36809 RepID=UPI0005DDCB74|nr:heavy-metal-associated domain-containing protein [Mycobacteroides abscessus]MBE5510519.1 hypothetical protein [Mycobacteroides abscessus]MBN7322839.1 heavy-metal-associated domain-containing protein [Mycobacteroides abscessus subsp. massiliense]MBN7388189.1 heavy-metal-associated domain-containing protein [Mycobacteroides abscessus subsp. abscessus]MBN7417666.1 heavy-metal-associated domain-containing protein [Mycobacteroides abscessus subsp. abscessus]MBN7488745.1 heavy-metal-associated do